MKDANLTSDKGPYLVIRGVLHVTQPVPKPFRGEADFALLRGNALEINLIVL